MRLAAWRSTSSNPLDLARLVAPALIAAALCAVPAGADAAMFYRWTDQDGTVHYADAPPKGYTGTVTRVEVDPQAHTVTPPPTPKPPENLPPAEPGASPPAQPPDILTQRRETRARLEANLERARERLDLARKALAEGGEPQGDEWQVTIGGPPGAGQVARSNCHKTQDGRTICPGRVPSAEYYSRVQQLDEGVKRAEAAVEEAERAYRQGVD